MKSWSDIRKTLEQDRLAPSLRGRVQYFITRYHHAHDRDGSRIAIRVDGTEVFKSNTFEAMAMDDELYRRFNEDLSGFGWREYCEHKWEQWKNVRETELAEGVAEGSSIYHAFREYDTQPIEQSLDSPNALVRVLALLDRRVGKRRLAMIKERGFDGEPEWVRFFYRLRLDAEGL